MSTVFDWYHIKFLESVENLKSTLSRSRGRTPNTNLAYEIAVCLQHGRAFFESARNSSLDIQPLIVFYGMMNFAKAVIMAASFERLAALPRSHGLREPSNDGARIENLALIIDEKGTLQRFNDAVRLHEALLVHDGPNLQKVSLPTSESTGLEGKRVPLKEILARIPDLEAMYQRTFGESAMVVGCSHFEVNDYADNIKFGIHFDEQFKDRESMKSIVRKLRSMYPVLERWRLVRASYAGGFTALDMTNDPRPKLGEMEPDDMEEDPYGYRIREFVGERADRRHVNLTELMQPVSGNLRNGATNLIANYEGSYLSEAVLYYLGMFVLSSLVRYKPSSWTSSISRRTIGQQLSDDKPIALVELFLEGALTNFPAMIVNCIRDPIP